MCTVSVITGYFNQRPETNWTPDTFGEFKEIIKRLDALDNKLDQPECHDPAKAAWMREVEDRLKVLEK